MFDLDCRTCGGAGVVEEKSPLYWAWNCPEPLVEIPCPECFPEYDDMDGAGVSFEEAMQKFYDELVRIVKGAEEREA